MLYDSQPGALGSAKMQQCKPDYESQIKSANAQLEKHEEFLNSIFKLSDNSMVQNKMAELVGELYSATISIQGRIDNLIAQQEADQR